MPPCVSLVPCPFLEKLYKSWSWVWRSERNDSWRSTGVGIAASAVCNICGWLPSVYLYNSHLGLTPNEQRPKVHECALSSLFKFAQQCFLVFFLNIPFLIITIMEFGISPSFVCDIYGTRTWLRESLGWFYSFIEPTTCHIMKFIDELNPLAMNNFFNHLWSLCPAWTWTCLTNGYGTHHSRIISNVAFREDSSVQSNFPGIMHRFFIAHWRISTVQSGSWACRGRDLHDGQLVTQIRGHWHSDKSMLTVFLVYAASHWTDVSLVISMWWKVW